ncbi:MAG: metal-sensing transcriptional repressor [Bacillus subtilis]|nr:metal-sensing transcriptional repressor [Bacillus subtilis]
MICEASLTNRIKRTKGQMQGVLTMMENGAACEDIVTQLKAIKASIEKAIALVATNNLIQTIEDENHIKLGNLEGAIQLIIKGM